MSGEPEHPAAIRALPYAGEHAEPSRPVCGTAPRTGPRVWRRRSHGPGHNRPDLLSVRLWRFRASSSEPTDTLDGMKKAPRHPTKMCPHRWCRPAHRIATLVFLIDGGIGLASTAGVVLLAISLVAVPIAIAISRMSAPVELVMPVRTVLRVSPGWARAALIMDGVWILFSALGITGSVLLAGQHQPVGTSLADIGPGAAIATALFGSWIYLHHRATRPRKPRRVRAWKTVLIPVKSSS